MKALVGAHLCKPTEGLANSAGGKTAAKSLHIRRLRPFNNLQPSAPAHKRAASNLASGIQWSVCAIKYACEQIRSRRRRADDASRCHNGLAQDRSMAEGCRPEVRPRSVFELSRWGGGRFLVCWRPDGWMGDR